MKYSYCPKCGNAYSEPQKEGQFSCNNCKFTLYLNSKPTASVLILNDRNEVLLGKRVAEPYRGMWDVIGGFLNNGESPEAGALREAKEETNLDVEIEKLLGFFMDVYGEDKDATLNICYIVRIKNGEPKAGDDIGELKWFSLYNLPEAIAFKNGQAMLDAYKNM